MPTSLVLTVLGEDRPGLVEALAHIIAAHEGNWLESRMAHLAAAGPLRKVRFTNQLGFYPVGSFVGFGRIY